MTVVGAICADAGQGHAAAPLLSLLSCNPWTDSAPLLLAEQPPSEAMLPGTGTGLPEPTEHSALGDLPY